MVSTKRILYVEDDRRDKELTLHTFAKHCIHNQVDHVWDGEEALDYLFRRNKYSERADDNPTVVLLDLKLPRVDGLKVLQVIKTTESLRRIPVVVMTSSREDQDLQRCYEYGVNAYVVKPINFHEFVDAIGQVGAFWGIINEPPVESPPEQ